MIVTTCDINHIYSITLVSRLFFLLVSFISNQLIPDHVSDGFTTPNITYNEFNIIDKCIWSVFSGLMRWDAQHFIHIGSNGYTYENNLPFFPLFPVIIKNLAFCLKFLMNLQVITSLLLSSFVINTVFFLKAASTLYLLTFTVFKNQTFAYYSVLFFIISPATVFFLAPYSETLFAFCVFKGMLKYVQNKYWYSLLWFSVSGFVRSNGIVNVIFILHLFYYFIYLKKFRNLAALLKYGFYSVFSVLIIFIPFIVYQIFAYLYFCSIKHNHSAIIVTYAEQKSLKLAGVDKLVWCNYAIPFSYQYIQSNYWNVGFLKYYTIEQIPNFILASPLVIIIFKYCVTHLCKRWKLLFKPDLIYRYDETPRIRLSESVLIFVLHTVYLTLFSVLNINVQVTTRLVASSSPILYWIASQEFIDPHSKSVSPVSFLDWLTIFNQNTQGNIIKAYFILYSIIGTVVFSNNLPWT